MRRPAVSVLALATVGMLSAVSASAVAAASVASAAAAAPVAPASGSDPGACRPAGVALAYSDALDKISYRGAAVGGLSSLAFDR